MKLEKVPLFSTKKDFFYFLVGCFFILIYSFLIEYQNFKKLIRFDTAIVKAVVIKQYVKSKDAKTYQVLKLKSDKGFTFYTTAKTSLENVVGKEITLEIFTDKITFFKFFTYFYAYSYVKNIPQTTTLKEHLNAKLDEIHSDKNISNIYKALYSASPLNKDLQTIFSSLGVSHLFAISGYHLGVLSGLILFMFKYPYIFFQDRFFPYRNSKRDIFLLISGILLLYLLFLDSPPSLLRAYFMLIIGFVLYDRGVEIVSMQTLLVSLLLLLSFFPKLFFSLGFWLSVSGVFYIFLYLLEFKNISKIWQFILMPVWVYLMMLPFSLSIFGNFSLYHPLSIVWTLLFTLFYPLSIFLHLIGFGDLLDVILNHFIFLDSHSITVHLEIIFLYIAIFLSFLALFKRYFIYVLLFYNLGILTYATIHL